MFSRPTPQKHPEATTTPLLPSPHSLPQSQPQGKRHSTPYLSLKPSHSHSPESSPVCPQRKGNLNCSPPILPNLAFRTGMQAPCISLPANEERRPDRTPSWWGLSPCAAWEIGPSPPLHSSAFQQAHSEQSQRPGPAGGTLQDWGKSKLFRNPHVTHMYSCM